MTNNALQFKRLMEYREVYADFQEHESGGTTCLIKQDLECGVLANFVISFSKDDTRIDIYSFDLINEISPLKKQIMYEFLNQLNLKYTFVKFVMQDNSINVSSHYILSEYNPELTVEYITAMVNIMTEEYDNFIELILGENILIKVENNMNNEFTYTTDVLSKMSIADWKRATKRGAEYLLEINIPDVMTYASMCAVIGLVVGGGDKLLMNQTFIDDIVVEEIQKALPISTYREISDVSSNTSKRLWNTMVEKKVYEPSSRMIFIKNFPFEQTLRQASINPEVGEL